MNNTETEFIEAYSVCCDGDLSEPENAKTLFEYLQSQGFIISRWRDISEAPKDGTPVLVKWSDGYMDAAIMHYEDGYFVRLDQNMGIARPPQQPTLFMDQVVRPLPPEEGEK